jgi:hypothetical protein
MMKAYKDLLFHSEATETCSYFEITDGSPACSIEAVQFVQEDRVPLD